MRRGVFCISVGLRVARVCLVLPQGTRELGKTLREEQLSARGICVCEVAGCTRSLFFVFFSHPQYGIQEHQESRSGGYLTVPVATKHLPVCSFLPFLVPAGMCFKGAENVRPSLAIGAEERCAEAGTKF